MRKLFIPKKLRYGLQVLSFAKDKICHICFECGNVFFAVGTEVISYFFYSTFATTSYKSTRETTKFHQFVVYYAQLYWQGIKQNSDACMFIFKFGMFSEGKKNLKSSCWKKSNCFQSIGEKRINYVVNKHSK